MIYHGGVAWIESSRIHPIVLSTLYVPISSLKADAFYPTTMRIKTYPPSEETIDFSSEAFSQ